MEVKLVLTINAEIHVPMAVNAENVPSVQLLIMELNAVVHLVSLVIHLWVAHCHCNVATLNANVMNPEYIALNVVHPMINAHADKNVLKENVALAVDQEDAQKVKFVEMEPALLDAATIWIVQEIMHASVENAKIHVY